MAIHSVFFSILTHSGLTMLVLSFDIRAVFQQKLTGESVTVGGGAVKRGLTTIVLGREEI